MGDDQSEDIFQQFPALKKYENNPELIEAVRKWAQRGKLKVKDAISSDDYVELKVFVAALIEEFSYIGCRNCKTRITTDECRKCKNSVDIVGKKFVVRRYFVGDETGSFILNVPPFPADATPDIEVGQEIKVRVLFETKPQRYRGKDYPSARLRRIIESEEPEAIPLSTYPAQEEVKPEPLPPPDPIAIKLRTLATVFGSVPVDITHLKDVFERNGLPFSDETVARYNQYFDITENGTKVIFKLPDNLPAPSA